MSTQIAEIKGATWTEGEIETILDKLEYDIVRGCVIDGNPRIDGRGNADIRKIDVEVGLLPRTHGSALFTRGETQAIVVVALGTEPLSYTHLTLPTTPYV